MDRRLLYRILVTIFVGYLGGVSYVSAQLSVSFPKARMVFQRNQQGQAIIQVTGQTTTVLDRIEVKFESYAAGQGQNTDWTTLQALIEVGEFSNTVTAPQGWNRLIVRGIRENIQVTDAVVIEPVGVGEVFMILGHSNASGDNTTERGANDDRVSSPQYASHQNLLDYQISADPNHLPNHYGQLCKDCSMAPFGEYAWFWGQLGDLLTQKLNVPVLFYSSALGGSNMMQTYMSAYNIPFEHGFIRYDLRMPYVNIKNTLTKYVPQTGLRAILSGHGINDVAYSTEEFSNAYQKVIEKSRQDANFPNLAWLVAISAYNNGVQNHLVEGQWQVISNDPYAFEGPNLNNINNDGRRDGLHFNVLGQQLAAQYWNDALSESLLSQISPIQPTVSTHSINVMPNAGHNQNLSCINGQPVAQANLSANAITGGGWSQVGGPTATIVDPSSPTTQIKDLIPATYSFKWTIGSFSDVVEIDVQGGCCTKPNAGKDTSLCKSTDPISHQLAAAQSGQSWAKGLMPANSQVQIDPQSGTITNLDQVGEYEFILKQGDSCSDTIKIFLNLTPTVISYGGDLFCGQPNLQLGASVSPTGGSYSWTGPGIVSGQNTSGPFVNSLGTYQLIYKVNGCSNNHTAVVNGNLAPPNAGPDKQICAPANDLVGVLPSGNWSVWTNNPANATITSSGNIAGMSQNGSYFFILTNGNCYDTVQVSRYETSKPIATTPMSYIQNQIAPQLSATGTNLKWYSQSTGGIGQSTAPTPSTAVVGTTYYYVSQIVNNCESDRTQVTVVVASPEPSSVCLDVKVLLQGNLKDGLLTTHLNTKGLLPGQTPTIPIASSTPAGQPYRGAPWNYTGTESVLNYDPDIVDWVLVSLRTTPQEPSTTVFKQAALLRKDGKVVQVGACPVLNSSQAYFVVVEHRNHIGAVSHVGVNIANNKLAYDFTETQSYILAAQQGLGQNNIGGKFCLFSGDGAKYPFNEINAEDNSVWRSANGKIGIYNKADYNLDGETSALDNILWRLNNGKFSAIKF